MRVDIPAKACFFDGKCFSFAWLRKTKGFWEYRQGIFGGWKEVTIRDEEIIHLGSEFRSGKLLGGRAGYLITRSLRGNRSSINQLVCAIQEKVKSKNALINALSKQVHDYENKLNALASDDRLHEAMVRRAKQSKKVHDEGDTGPKFNPFYNRGSNITRRYD